MNVKGFAHKYGDNVDTDVIIPARYLNTADPGELRPHLLPQFHQHRPAHPGVPRGERENRRRGRNFRGF